MVSTTEGDLKAIFDRYDRDLDGVIPLKDLVSNPNLRKDVRVDVLEKISRKADHNQDGHLNYEEFVHFYNSPELPFRARLAVGRFKSFARKIIVPKSKRLAVRRGDDDAVDIGLGLMKGEDITWWPPPVTILALTILEIAVFIYYSVTIGNTTQSGPIPYRSPLIYNPKRRYEIWRYVTYMLIHAGYLHLIFNMLLQLTYGILLESVHKFWRVWLVYMFGVLAGSLGTSIVDPTVYLAGASAGVYALITGHLATIIMNFKDMEYPFIQLAFVLVYMLTDITVAIVGRYTGDEDTKIGYAAHICGSLAGLLVGIVALRNFEKSKWEKMLWWISLISAFIFFLAMVIWNAALPSYFPKSDWS